MSCLKTYNASPRLKWKNLPRPLIKKTVSSLNICSKRQEQFGISHYGCVLLSQIPRLDKKSQVKEHASLIFTAGNLKKKIMTSP